MSVFRLPVAVLLAATMVLTGCALIKSEPKPQAPGWQGVTVMAAEDANANSAVAVDIVLVRDQAVLDSLLAMPAARYFAARADLQRTYPDALTVVALEITPGQVIRLDARRFGGQRAWAALAFAHYANPGEHRARLLLDNRGYVLQLNAQGMLATELTPGRAR